jgi:threonyl-tRNA synthetase
VNARLRERGIRSEVDDSDNTMGAKIRHQQLQKVPYMLVVGDKEVDADTVSVRKRTGEESRGVAVDEFIEKLAVEIDEKLLDLSA